jgi:salicylate hydroxylase
MTTPGHESQALIAGGGIGGLAASIALARAGLPATVLERSTFADETGAGIQLGPNATRILRQLGVLDTIEAAAFRPEAIWLFDGLSSRRLATIPLARLAEQRYGTPYLTLHRADLHEALVAACQGLTPVALRPSFNVTAVEDRGNEVVATADNGESVIGSCLIAADGLWSGLRERIAPDAKLSFTGDTAWRACLPRADLRSPFDAPVVGLWLGPRAHLVHYPVRGGKDLNVVAVVAGGEAEIGWAQPGDASALQASFASWAKTPKSLLDSIESWRGWSLYRLPPLPRWSAGNIALLGDAAHPVMPYLAQGAALALEDANAIGSCLQTCGGDAARAFARYETLRRARARRVQRTSRRLGHIYHLRGPLRHARNLALGLRQPEAHLAAFDWLYGPKER